MAANDAVGDCGLLLRPGAFAGNSNVAGVVGSEALGIGKALDFTLGTFDADSEVVMLMDDCLEGMEELAMSSGSDMTVLSSGTSGMDCSLRRWKPDVVGGDPARD